ncbi:FAD-binding domain-containing protein 32 [Elsinoe australis]|uniref:FAD-binding domain-containing protein 32 n=1 Tax=Elsinoe australis TaxID=40998 RepID=A0A4U7B006_9PEZI|nr:FAD-binding domain-containing protein 32 [Elsinoe australis]
MHLQFHHSSYRPGSPTQAPASPSPLPPLLPLPSEVDVLIIGAGPAGLCLAAQLAQFSDLTVALAEQKRDRLKVGQADGIQCRSIEIFEAFGFSERVVREGYWVNETVFWRADYEGVGRGAGGKEVGVDGEGKGKGEGKVGIVRSGRTRDVPEGVSEFPHVILNQARIHDFWLDVMAKGARPAVPFYGKALVGLERREGKTYPVTATFEVEDEDGKEVGEKRRETVRAKYVVGCDGARSAVRSQLGLSLQGDSANQAWGVMDVLCITSFPDIRFKCVIHSERGNIVIIPREGGYLVRLYIELGNMESGIRVRDMGMTKDDLIEKAKGIFWPHTFDVKDVFWWSVYEIGQRLCPQFDDSEIDGSKDPRIFIMGDACHTHSPKAGQGMNVSMQDGFNMGWKLASVLRGLAHPDLLRTYSTERYAIAKELIDFDRELIKMYGRRAKQDQGEDTVDPKEFQRYFTKALMYTSGVGYSYPDSSIVATKLSANYQHLASGFPVGERFHSHSLVRFFDAKPIQLGHTVRADGRWRIFLFNDNSIPYENATHTSHNEDQGKSKLLSLCDYLLNSPSSPINEYRYSIRRADELTNGHSQQDGKEESESESIIEVLAILQQSHDELHASIQESGSTLPAILIPKKGRYGLANLHNVFCDEKPYYNIWGATMEWKSMYEARGVSKDEGAMIVVRPDGYVAAVFPLDLKDEGHELLEKFFAGFMSSQKA